MITITLLVVLFSVIVYLVRQAQRRNRYWAERGIKNVKGVPFLGNNWPMLVKKKHFVAILQDIYNEFPNEMVYGYYDFMTPRLCIRDGDLIQKILIKDFSHFTDRGMSHVIDVEKHPRQEQLFFMNGNRWRAVRTKVSPIFTSGKLKDMFTTMTCVGENLLDYLKEKENEEIDAKEVMGLFSMDVISSAVFGSDPATLKNPNCEFRQKGKQLFEMDIKSLIRTCIAIAFPKLMKAFNISLLDQKVINYFCDIIQKTFDYRRNTGCHRNDFIQLMMQLKEKGSIEVHTWDSNDDYLVAKESEHHLEKVEITDDLLMGQAHTFMINGFETTSTVMTFTLFELTQHEDFQNRLCEEIAEQVKINGGLTYEALKNMTLLDCTIKEVLRLHPVVPAIFRACTKTYELPSSYIINKGDPILIPVDAIHKDPNNFSDPNAFKPERFLDPIKQGIYFPFGEGPRICIAMRYALMVSKYGIALFLLNYKVMLSEKVKMPLKFDVKGFGIIPKDKILLKLKKCSSRD